MAPRMDRTPWNPDWAQAIERVTKLIESLFACRVQFQTVESFLDIESKALALFHKQDLVFLESTLFEPPTMIRGNQPGAFAFPLRVRRSGAPASDVSLVGMATIEGLAASDDERLQQLGEFLQMAVEARLDAFERLLDIERREMQILIDADIRESSKIVQLFPRGFAPTEDDKEEPFRLRNYSDELNLTKPLLLVGSSQSTAAGFPFGRVALELFNRTSLWFFVNIADLSEDAFASAQAFRDLGRMCIYIPDLARLPIERQIRLAEVFGSAEQDADSPRLIIAIHEAAPLLVRDGLVLPHLLAMLTSIEFNEASLEKGTSSRGVRTVVQQIETQLKGPASLLVPATKASNLIPLLGRWRQDDNSNPTFH
jgi:hypothetical protein